MILLLISTIKLQHSGGYWKCRGIKSEELRVMGEE
jgi:hypothetical protein